MPKRPASASPLPLAALPDPRAALLLWGSPREILARLGPGDPLGLSERLRRRVRARALLVDARILLPRLRALVARRAFEWRGEPPLEVFLDAAVDGAIAAYLAEAAESSAEPGVCLSPRRLAGFARLPQAVREAFVAALVEARALDRLASEREQDLSALGRDLRQAIDQLVPPAHPDPPGSGRAAS